MPELTPENVAAISTLLHDLGWASQSIQSLESAGEGNMNRTLRARLDDGSSMILKQSVDHVAKYPDIAAPIERIGVEAAFYAAIAQHPVLRAQTPALIGYDAANHLIGMQDLGTSSDISDVYVGNAAAGQLATETLSHVLSWLSELHAIAPPRNFPTNTEMRKLNHAHIFDLPLHSTTHEQLAAFFGPKTRQIAAAIASNESLRARVQQLGDIYLSNDHDVLLHGDFYPASWLRCDSTDVYIIDPEFAFVGPAEFDVGVFMAHLTFAGFERAAIIAALEHYRPPSQFDLSLAEEFAGMEIIRRILGVAQLPLSADDETKVSWLTTATGLLLGD